MNKKEVLAWLEKKGTKKTREAMPRYGIVAKRAFGVSMGALLTLKKKIGTDHALANELWASGVYEARLLAPLVGDPALVTKGEMDRWARSFENWADTDTVCFKLWDRSPHAWAKATQWVRASGEFRKRAAFALMASLALHQTSAPDAAFLPFLPLIEKGARDERNFVKKGVSWALRSIGRRPGLRKRAFDLANRLSTSDLPQVTWVGRDAAQEIGGRKRSK